MELIFQNLRAFRCDISDYNNIIAIHESRPRIHGVLKTPAYDDYIRTLVADILMGRDKTMEVLGVEDIQTGKLITYGITHLPINSSAFFFKVGETLPSETPILTYNSGIVEIFNLAFSLAEKKRIYDMYICHAINAVVPILNLMKNSSKISGKETRMHWMIHKVVGPEDPLITSIDKTLLGGLLFKRKLPVAILHATLKEKFRIEHFKDAFNVSENQLRKHLED